MIFLGLPMQLSCVTLYLLGLLSVCLAAYFPDTLAVFINAPWAEQYYVVTLFICFLTFLFERIFVREGGRLTQSIISIFSIIVVSSLIHAGLLNIHVLLNSQNTLIVQWAWGLSFRTFLLVISFSAVYLYALNYPKNSTVHAQALVCISLLFLPPVLAQAISFWIPDLVIDAPNKFVINTNLANCITIIICMASLLRAYAINQTIGPLLTILLILVVQTVAIWQVKEGSLWVWLATSYAEIEFSLAFAISGLLAAQFALIALYIFYKRA